jgi:hypothetical protein
MHWVHWRERGTRTATEYSESRPSGALARRIGEDGMRDGVRKLDALAQGAVLARERYAR